MTDPVTPTDTKPDAQASVTLSSIERPTSRFRRIVSDQQFILVVVLVILVVIFTIINPVFFSVGAASNILVQWAPLVLIAVGETFVIISGGIDLSVGSTLTLSGVVAAFAMQSLTVAGWSEGPTLLVGAVICLVIGAVVGTVNALLVNVAKLVPFVATLATLGAGGGVALVLTGGGPVSGGPPNATSLAAAIGNGLFSWPVIVVIVILVITGLFLHRARFGRYTFAIGGNAFAATASGISVARHLAKVYILSGLFAGAGGFVLYLQLGGGSPSAGTGDELSAIAAVVIGGASLTGGFGKIGGTILGALILETVYSGLTIINIDPNWNAVAVGILIAAAASLQAVRGIQHRRKS
jgi:ribose transport system permease protein